jgi:2-polyprenyl-6-hydroxyphenyl methylase/3-demethylubiquinone-9 3-methyltransferase
MATTVDASEIAKFSAMAEEWWDVNGKFKPLHLLNPCRLDYLCDQIAFEFDRNRDAGHPFKGLRVLDIGCGGGLVAEPMARLGASVVGVDASVENIGVARAHALGAGLRIDYRAVPAETLIDSGEVFDVVLTLEVIEHVADPAALLSAVAALLKPGGLHIASTLNRTPQSFALGIVAAERILRWLPPGTHDWKRFVIPDEMYALMQGAGLSPVDRKGMVFNPISGRWRLSDRDLAVNYLAAAVKP